MKTHIRRLYIYIIMLLAGLTVTADLYAQTNTDSIRIARQRQIDSTREAQARYYDSLRVARKRVLDSTRVAQEKYNDSVQLARKRQIDSAREAREKYNDSVKVARQHALDSIKAERQRVSDSLSAIREYRNSKRYKDSVTAIREARLDSIKQEREQRMDSIAAERQRRTDSIAAVRKAYVDSIKTIQQRRSDSLAAIREYRNSDRYKDSLAVVRKLRLDSIKAERKAYYDSVAAERKAYNDSVAADRKAYTDSLMAVRQAFTDSLKEVRQQRTDSLAKLKEKREKERKLREKQREEKAQLALELKIQKKREAWSNEQMLKKRWGFPRSSFQNLFTRDNYYFNADLKMDEALDNMQRFRQENFDSLLALYPYDPDRDSSVLSSDMDSIIQKASVGIQIHDPRTRWADDLYLLLGQAYYYKADYENAASAFKYVVALEDKYEKKKKSNKKRTSSKNNNSIVQDENDGFFDFMKHRKVHNEAILWLARTYTEDKHPEDAETILDLVEADPNFQGSLQGRLALEKAYIRLTRKDYRGATEYLGVVAKDKDLPDWIRRRSAFINGQLNQRFERYDSAVVDYKEVLALNPKLDMGFYAKKNLATSLMMTGKNQDEAIDILEKVLKEGKYVKYYEQVYYVLGQLSLSNGDETKAVAYLKEGISSPKTSNEQKALSYATLGNIYYDQRRYEMAKSAYDSAVALQSGGTTDLMRTATRRSEALTTLTKPLRVIKDNDSLLYLASLSDKDQRSIVRKYIKMLEDRRRDSIFLAQNAGVNAAKQNTSGNSKNNYENWYFTNAGQMQKGYNDFKQKWGNRPLVDNWRRLSSGGFAKNDSDQENSIETDADGIPTEESLLAAIPNDAGKQDELRKEVRDAYIEAANAYVKDLEDYPPGVNLLDTLDVRFPEHEHKAEALYLRYLVALRQDRLDEAQKYSNELLSKYGVTEWAKIVRPTEDGAGMNTNNETMIPFYDKTYSMLLDGQYEAALPRAKEGQRRFPDKEYQSRFQIIEAMSLAKLGELNTADSVLTVFMTTHTDPNDSLRSWAEAVLKYVSDTRTRLSKLPQGNTAGGTDSTAGGNKTAGNNIPKTPNAGNTSNNTSSSSADYQLDMKEEHFVIFTFTAMEQRTMGVKAAIDDFNKFKFGSLNLSTDVNMLQGATGVVTISSFRNKNQALIYLNSLKKSDQVFREYDKSEYQLMMISAPNHKKLVESKNMGAYMMFYNKNYK